MARNIYKSAMSSSLGAGKLRANMYDISSLDTQKEIEVMELRVESEKLNKTISTLSDALALSSTIAGRYGDISDNIETLEGEFGEMEKPDTMLGKLLQSAKIGFGVGEFQFGDETISGRDIAPQAAKITQQNMYEEALSNMTKSDSVVPNQDVINRQREQLANAQALQTDNESFSMDMDSEDDMDDPDKSPEVESYLERRYKIR